jgi:hypothetical protein
VTVLEDARAAQNPKDEGWAMLQLIHDIAPDTKLYFRTAFFGAQDFANGINELADAGCNVIVGMWCCTSNFLLFLMDHINSTRPQMTLVTSMSHSFLMESSQALRIEWPSRETSLTFLVRFSVMLMRQVNPRLTSAEVYGALASTVIDMKTAGFDFNLGAGLVV